MSKRKVKSRKPPKKPIWNKPKRRYQRRIPDDCWEWNMDGTITMHINPPKHRSKANNRMTDEEYKRWLVRLESQR